MKKAVLLSLLALAVSDLLFGADQGTRIKFATILPRGTSAHQALLEMNAQWQKAGIAPILYADGTQGSEAEIVKRMRIGQLQGAVLSVAGLKEIDRSVAALQLMPKVFRSLDEVTYVRERIRPLLEKRLEDKDFLALCWADAGWVQIFSTKPVTRPAEVKRLKIFNEAADGNQLDLMKSVGFQAVSMEYTDTLTGLQTGLIEAAPTTPFFALAGQFYRPAPYMLELNYVPLVGAIVVTRKAWAQLPPPIQEAMRKAAEEAGAKITLHGRQEMVESIAAMQKRGLKVTQVTPEVEAEWHAEFERIYPRIRGNLVPTDVFDEVQRLLREYRK